MRGPARQSRLALGILLCLLGTRTAAAAPCEAQPFRALRYDEDYSSFDDPACRARPLDTMKYLGLGGKGASYFSWGADLRERYEYVSSVDFGRAAADDNGYVLQRALLHANLRLFGRVRAFAELQSGLYFNHDAAPRSTDKDELDLHQAFLDLTLGSHDSVTLRAGRQELAFGSSRLVSVRDKTNLRRSFDGARLIAQSGGWQMNAFALAPVINEDGVFDNRRAREHWFWGSYSAGALAAGLGIDVYYLGLHEPESVFNQGAARELRHSWGARLWGKPGAFDYDFELVYQWGSFGDANIRAYMLASNTGYTFHDLPAEPRFGLKVNAASGDEDANDPDLQTFNPLFPRGTYYGEASLVGSQNLVDVHPALDLSFGDSVLAVFDWDIFWRHSSGDGLYRSSTLPQISHAATRQRFVGSQAAVTLQWQATRHLSLTGAYVHFFAGRFLRESAAEDVDYATAWLALKL
ncbi:MAG TPA: alginate export family protein [Polyangiaceae bacterium]|nr:alginate export family protein [Polyangiaceae bacterium]